jgi:hypothetical protein
MMQTTLIFGAYFQTNAHDGPKSADVVAGPWFEFLNKPPFDSRKKTCTLSESNMGHRTNSPQSTPIHPNPRFWNMSKPS